MTHLGRQFITEHHEHCNCSYTILHIVGNYLTQFTSWLVFRRWEEPEEPRETNLNFIIIKFMIRIRAVSRYATHCDTSLALFLLI